MTKEEKAREIISQSGGCKHVSCDYGLHNECPCYNECSEASRADEAPDKIRACQRFLGIQDGSTSNKTLIDEFAIAAMSALFPPYGTPCDAVAKDAYNIAAAMMAERARRDENGKVIS